MRKLFTIVKGDSLRSPQAGCGRPQAAVLAGASLDATHWDVEQKPATASPGASVPTNG